MTKLNWDTSAPEASADIMGRSEAEMALQG